jgi:MFS family permease
MTEPVHDPFGRRFVSPLLIGTLLNPVNSAMIATTLVPIGRDLHAGPASTVWLVAGLYLAAAVGQPTMGRIADMYGPRKVIVAGLVLVLGTCRSPPPGSCSPSSGCPPTPRCAASGTLRWT